MGAEEISRRGDDAAPAVGPDEAVSGAVEREIRHRFPLVAQGRDDLRALADRQAPIARAATRRCQRAWFGLPHLIHRM